MKNILIILVLLSFAASGQTTLGSKSFTNSVGTTKKDTFVIFSKGGYADYPIRVSKDGKYNFTVQVKNVNAKSIYAYMFSTSANAWSTASVPVSSNYQDVNILVPLTTATTYARLYLSDSAHVNSLKYSFDTTASGIDIAPLLLRLTKAESSITIMLDSIGRLNSKVEAVKNTVDSIPTIYIQEGYGTQTNPVKPN